MSRELESHLEEVLVLCRQFGVAELSVFGSALRDDYRPESDVDLLVTFRPEVRIGLLRFAELRDRLSDVIGRRVDLVPRNGLKPALRDEVLGSARVIYAA